MFQLLADESAWRCIYRRARGLALGLAGSVAAAREIASMLYGTKALDAGVFGGVSAAMVLVAAAACAVPAWRASRLDPMTALRTE